MRFNSFPSVCSQIFAVLIAVTPGFQIARADCFSTPAGLIGWWTGDGSANNVLGTNNGTLQGGATANGPGMVGTAFNFDGTNGYVQVPNSTILQPTNFTIEAWVRFNGLDSAGSSAAGDQYIVFKQNTRSTDFEGFDLSKSRVSGTDYFRFLVVSASGQIALLRSATAVSTGVWYHVAAVRGPTFMQLYVNGVMERQTNVTFAQSYGSLPLYFGTSGQPAWDHKLKGNLDEVSIYNRALSSNEIAAVFAGGTAGKCKGPTITAQPQAQTVVVGSDATFTVGASGFGALKYQWSLNGSPLSNATNVTLLVTNAQPAHQGNYSVMVSNNLGSVVSSNALLTVVSPQPGVPFISGFNPTFGSPGTVVAISGFSFSPVTASNLVYFGATRANVLSAGPNSLSVTVPVGATFAPITVTVTGLTAVAQSPFVPTFVGDGTPVSSTTFAAGQNLSGDSGNHRTAIADLDGDGWPDLAVANVYAHTVSLFRNFGGVGPLSPASFSARVDFPTIGGGSDNPFALIAADVDGDGRRDLVITDRINNRIGIYRNQATTGSLSTNSFAAPIYFNTGADPRYVRAADLDRDGRIDLVVCNLADGTISILRNTGTAGTLDANSFTPRVDLASGAGASDVAIQDFDGDGRPDLAVANGDSGTLSLFRNVSVPGTLDPSSFEPRVDLPANSNATIATGDVDGDGKADLVAGGISGLVSIYRNLSSAGSFSTGSFAPRVDYANPGWVHNVVLGDVNGDSKPDVVVVGELGSFMRVYQNQSASGGVLLTATDYPTGWNAWGVSVGDVDGDQRSDIVFCNAYDNTITLYRNQQPFGGPPFITTHPVSQSVAVGNNATLSVLAGGQSPLSYQWRLNGTNLIGATNASLMLTSAQFSQSGNYTVRITNTLGAVTSSVAVVTVLAPGCVAAPAGIVGWWSGNGQAVDGASTNHGTLVGNVTYGTGRVGQGFVLDGANDGVVVGNPASLQLQNFTIETWIKRANTSVASFGSHTAALFFGYGSGGYGLGMLNDGRLFLTRVDIDNVTLNTPVITDTNLHHVAVTKTGSTVFFYIDGVVYSVPAYNTTYTFGSTAAIGMRPDSLDDSFLGLIDEVAVYNRALSSAEIQSLYNSGGVGKCAVPPTFVQSPQGRTNFEGQTGFFTAAVTGPAPIGYQWFYNGASINDGARVTGATSNSLSIVNLSTNDTGNYWLVASNVGGVVTSAVATLTVNPITCAAAPTGLVGWWQAEGNGADSANTNAATLQNGVTFAAGKAGQGFSFDGVDDLISLPATANGALNVGLSNGLTIECWINPADVQSPRPLVEWNQGGSFPLGVHLWISEIGSGPGAGCIYVNLMDTAGAEHKFASAAGIVSTNVFQHVAVTYDKASGLATLFHNGMVVASQNVGMFTPQTALPLYFGHRADTAAFDPGYFVGRMDEIGIYNRALSTAEIEGIFVAGSLAKCPTAPSFVRPLANAAFPLGGNMVLLAAGTGSQPLNYQWYFNGGALTNSARLSGATNNTLVISNGVLADAGNYFVVLTNPYGSATSTVANVLLGNAPVIVQQPINQNGAIGGTVQFVTQVTGDEPLIYRWYQNTTALSDDARHLGTATTNLVITNLVSGDAGNYTLRVTNTFGSVTSAVATLAVFTPPAITTQPKGYSVPIGLPVTLAGAASGTAPLRYQWVLNGAPVLSATNFSLTISNLAVTNFGNYQLVVTNGGGAVTSAVAAVTVGTVGTWGIFTAVASAPIWPAAGLSNVVSVAAGNSYSMALRQDGTVHVWGFNNPATNVPPGLSGVVGLAAGQSHALALLSNGIVRAWGLGSSGQTNVPATLSNVIAVAAGSAHSAALRSDGTIIVWGGSSVEAQTNIPPGLMKIVAIDAGGSQTLALREDGSLFGWGGRTPYPVPYDLKNVAGFSAGPAFSALNLALLSNGTIRAWGGSGPATNVPPGLSNLIVVEGAGGSDQSTGVSLAVRSNRTVVGWGGLFGASSLTNIPAGLSNVLALAGGSSHALALIDEGRPLIIRPPVGGTFYSGRDLALKAKAIGNSPMSFRWFKDGNAIPGGTDESLVLPFAQSSDAGSYYLVASNALGVAQSVTVPVTIMDRAPVLMSQPLSRFAYYGSPFSVGASVIGSGPMDLTWLQNGVPAYFGTNDLVFERALPQHGGGFQLIASNPFGAVTSSVAQIRFSRVAAWGGMPAFTNIPIELDLGTVRGVAAGGFHALVIRSNGTVAAWGSQLYGTTNVPAGLTDVAAVAAGTDFSVALKQDGTVVAWGLNSLGQTNVPANLTGVSAISVGASHSLALRSDGTVVAWGLNSSGQTNVPEGLSNVVAIAAGSVHSLALKRDGSIVGWGTFGKIPTYSEVVAIAAGLGQSLALQADGTIRAWSTSGTLTGLPPAGLSNVVAISAGVGVYGNTYQAVALKPDGTIAVWASGPNNFGFANVPPDLTSAIFISPGGSGTMAYLNDRSPSVATQPLNRHAVSGTNVTFAALSVGQPSMNFQWRLNGADIPGAISPTLTLTNVSRDSRGNYSALVWNALGSTNSQAAWLEVVGPVRLLPPTGGSTAGSVNFVAADALGGVLDAGDAGWLEVQASTNLVNWQTLANTLVFTNGTLLLQDAAQTNYPLRFYRLIEH